MEVGFLGLGIMGKAMSMNLLKNGFKVTVWNRTLSKCDELVEHGASVCESPAEVIKKCKYTIAMLSDPCAALSICEGKGYIDMSTVDAETSLKINEAITGKGGRFVEGPVSGSKKPAEDGQLIILAAGDKALFEESIPAFDVLGKRSFYLGQVGNGAKMKLIVNMIMGSMMNAFSEGLVLADKSGLSSDTLLDILDLGAMTNPMFKGKGPSMNKSSYPPAFPLKHQQKDMRLALALGDENAVSMPVAAAANEAFKKARSLGLGDLDFSAVIEAVKFSRE
ncbi:glyoxylate reductase 1 [Arabidopsis thaliana]|uniref:Isoform 2 of Glyoxylate/succinic semialdehyde reductase 1 n=1 Tax=Arabidopsis thaliana TaxID=3702 RepID=Q9LSV0-2|nr:glyoxylate reductase 1 [Arabidopsis thaliana]AEE77022.1 glyoxylate reductase 1 [Arabidopsis thaliana]|eukprot:NP_001030765.1 glyoxylate reductase 1 [Arabidopsis thaliana]